MAARSRRDPSSSCGAARSRRSSRRSAREGVQSLLLEGGPTIASAFLAAGLVDRLLVFVAPVLAGGGPQMLASLPEPIDLRTPTVERFGDDVLFDVTLQEA